MKVLFIHQNFPGQFRHLAAALGESPDHEVIAIGEAAHLGRLDHANVRELGYEKPAGPGSQTHHYLRTLEGQVRRGQQVARVAKELRGRGYVPDVICCHPAWGEGLFLREIWPESRLLYYFEFFYRAEGLDTGFDPEFPRTLDDRLKTRMLNANHLLSLETADWGLCPTQWQHSTLPDSFKSRVSVIFDGIDTETVAPDPAAQLQVNDSLTLSAKDEVITFVNRNLEPYRGYHIFMRALPELMARRPNAHIVIVGGDGVSYGRRPGDGISYKQRYLDEVASRIDQDRVHFLGRVPYETYLNVLNVSAAHVYLTYPFVLSWSMLEAMSAGCALVASSTPPVTEFVRDGENGLLFDFFSPDELIEQTCRVLEDPDRMSAMRAQARADVVNQYDLRQHCLPQQIALINKLAAGKP